jgi:ribosome maturation factor RimP
MPAAPAAPPSEAMPVAQAIFAAAPKRPGRPGHAELRKRTAKARPGSRPASGRRSAAHGHPAGPGSASREAGVSIPLTPEIEAELAEVAAAAGCELVHVEWKGGVLRLVLDRPPVSQAPSQSIAPSDPSVSSEPSGPSDSSAPSAPSAPSDHSAPRAASVSGVSLADCEQVARQASALLDVVGFGRGRYLLEVSSPGLDRQLYGPRDYERFAGRLARITYETTGTEGGTARRTVVARLAELRRSAAEPETPAAGPRALPAAGELTLIDDKTGERLTLKLASIRLARLEVEL